MAEVKVDTGKAQENVNNLQKEMRKLLVELRNLESGSDEFVKMSEKVGELQDKINDASEAARANAGPAFERLGNNFGLVTQKLSSLDLGGAAESMRAFGSSIKAISIKEFVQGIGSLTSSLASLGKVLLTNPLFLLGAAIFGIISNFEKLKDAGGLLGSMFNAISNSIDFVLQGFKDLMDAIGLTNFKAQEALEKQVKLAEQIKSAIEKIDEDISKSREDAIKKYDGNLQKAYEAEKKRIDEITELNNTQIQQYEKLIASGKKLTTSQSATYEFFKTENQKLKENLLSFEAEVTKDNEEKAKERAKVANEEYEKRQAKIKSFNEYRRKVENDLLNARIANQSKIEKFYKTSEDRTLLHYEENQAKRRQKYENEKRVQFELIATDEAREIAAVDAKYIELRKLAGNNADLLKQIAEKNQIEVAEVQKKYAEIEKQKERELLESKFQMASDAMNALTSLSDALAGDSEKSAKRAFKINKALSLAQAIMSTYQAVNAQLAVPQDALTGANFIKAGIALAAGLANVIKIQKTKFEGGGGSPSPSGGGGGGLVANAGDNQSTATPAFNVLDTGFLSDRPAQGAPVQAYVLSSDVSSSLEASQKVQSLTVL
jgi:hypothetical protein